MRHLLLCLILLELFLGGGGRLINTGAVSIRMILFTLTTVMGIIILVDKKSISASVLHFVVLWTFTILLGFVIGIVNGNSLINCLLDIKPLLFILTIIFLYFSIRSESDIRLISRLVKFSSLLMAITYIVIFTLINTNNLPFVPFYTWASSTEEFFFRGEFAFFYKGFLYMVIGLFFFKWNDGKFSKVSIVIISAAVLITYTRGFILSLFITYFLFFLLTKKASKFATIVLVMTLVLAPVIWNFISSSQLLDRSQSDSIRMKQIVEVYKDITPTSTFVGHGFGRNISSRDDLHLEISYLEIFHKQGMVGLLFWLYFFFRILASYVGINQSIQAQYGSAFFLSSLFIFILSFTNPFINNPIGLTMLIISLISLELLKNNPDLIGERDVEKVA